jgi:hypothetical protein
VFISCALSAIVLRLLAKSFTDKTAPSLSSPNISKRSPQSAQSAKRNFEKSLGARNRLVTERVFHTYIFELPCPVQISSYCINSITYKITHAARAPAPAPAPAPSAALSPSPRRSSHNPTHAHAPHCNLVSRSGQHNQSSAALYSCLSRNHHHSCAQSINHPADIPHVRSAYSELPIYLINTRASPVG